MSEVEVKIDRLLAEVKVDLLDAIRKRVIGQCVATWHLSQGGINDFKIGVERKVQPVK